MNKKEFNDTKNNKLLVVSKISVVNKIKDFFRNIFKKSKKDVREENKTTIIPKIKKVEVLAESQLQERTTNNKKDNDNKSYYKMIYDGINDGKYTFEDLSPSEIITIMKMQKVENEFILKKLKQAMDNY